MKIFCIGLNKTGTTSLTKVFLDLGFKVGNQREAELLTDFYFKGDFQPIIDYCKKYQVFQDVPFSYPGIFKEMDKAFPGSKFILTTRDNPEQYYNSIINFHSKIFGNGKIPTVENLKNSTYVKKGWVWKNRERLFNITEQDDPYDKQMIINFYNKHNQEVLEYFKNRKNDLLVLNLS